VAGFRELRRHLGQVPGARLVERRPDRLVVEVDGLLCGL
jgi:hypothetical protein